MDNNWLQYSNLKKILNQDESIAFKVEKGVQGAQNTFYKRFYRVAQSYGFKFRYDPRFKSYIAIEDIEEIANEAIRIAIESLLKGTVDNKSSIRSFIKNIVENKINDLIDYKTADIRGGGEIFHIPLDDRYIANNQEEQKTDLHEQPSELDQFSKEEYDNNIDAIIDEIGDLNIRSIMRLKRQGYENRYIMEIYNFSQKEFDKYRKRVNREIAYIKESKNSKKIKSLFYRIEPRLEDFQYLFEYYVQKYKYLNHDLKFSLGIIHEILLKKLPKTKKSEILHFKLDVLLFLVELLVNKGFLGGYTGAIQKVPLVLDLCDETGNLESKIRIKNAESIAWRILKRYDKALEAISIAETFMESLKNQKVKMTFKYKLMGYKARILSQAGLPEIGNRLLTESLYYIEDNCNMERILVSKVDLADNNIIIREFDKAFEQLKFIKENMPYEFINLKVKYHKTQAKLLFTLGDIERGISSLREAWQLSDRVILYNQYNDLIDLLSRYSIGIDEVLSKPEIDRTFQMINIFQRMSRFNH